MKRRKLKLFVVPAMYVMSIAMLVGSVYVIERIINNAVFESEGVEEVEEVIYREDTDWEEIINDVPVVNEDVKIGKPYINEGVKIVKDYYDYKADSASQENSIVYYGNTYMQNSGVDYGMDGEFEVVSILDGDVIEVVDDDIMGKTVKIKHSNDLISVYQSMGSVDVKKDDKVTQGMVIGKSGEANVSPELGNHLHFELYYQGSVVNPLEYYDKLLGELE